MEPVRFRDEGVAYAMEIIFRKLNAHPRTRFELDRYLREKNISESTRHDALDRVTEMGYIDDREFARAWVHSRIRSRGLAPAVLQRELTSKGVSPEFIEEALAGVDPEHTRSRGYELAEKKMRSLTSVSPQIAIQRIYSLLQRKGYRSAESLEIARHVVSLHSDVGFEQEFAPGLEPLGD